MKVGSDHVLFDFIPSLLARGLEGLHRTCRIEILGERYNRQLWERTRPVLLTAWHFAFPAVIHYFRRQGGLLMVSRSRDGEIAAQAVRKLGYITVRGSSHRGGSRALREMLTLIQKGHSGGFVADGSQGPPRIAQKGILLVARYAQAPLIPVSMAAKPCVRLRSWDRTVLPLPFSKVVLAIGPPIWVRRDADSKSLEAARLQLEQQLNLLTRRAEIKVGATRFRNNGR